MYVDNINVMEVTKAHKAQWKKYSVENLNIFKVTGEKVHKARHEACERLLSEYCTQT